MKPFQPSVAFLRYYEAVMAEANGPINPGMGPVSIPIPDLKDIRERAFVTAKLAPLISAINTYRTSVPAPGTSITPTYDSTAEWINSMSAP